MNKQQYKELYTLLNNSKVDLYGLKADLLGTWMEEKSFCEANKEKSVWLKVTEYTYRAFESGLSVASNDLVREVLDCVEEVPNLYQKRVRALIRINAHNYL